MIIDYKKEAIKKELEQKDFVRRNGKRSYILDCLITYYKRKLSN